MPGWISPNDVGELFTTNGRDVWRVVSYAAEPTAVLQNLETGENAQGVVCSPLMSDFVRLTPTEELRPERPHLGARRPLVDAASHKPTGEASP